MLVPGVVLWALAFGLWFGGVGTAGLFWLVERLVRFLGCQCALSCIGPVVGTRLAGVLSGRILLGTAGIFWGFPFVWIPRDGGYRDIVIFPADRRP